MPNANPLDVVHQAIQANPQQRITFAEYMDLVLYHPEVGYYAARGAGIGDRGDFLTAPHIAADFGEMLAVQFVQMWTQLGKPVPFQLVEMGAGTGILAGDVLHYLQRQAPDLFAALAYNIIEIAPAMQTIQQKNLANWGEKVRWLTWEGISDDSVTGCFFSNELVDALPVHQFVLHQGELLEVYLTQQNGDLSELLAAPSTPQLLAYFDLIGIEILGVGASLAEQHRYPDGYRSEVNLAALDWLARVARKLHRGYHLIIDYGHTGDRYYNPYRTQGTLQCYYQHRYHSNPYANPGRQDITTHVCFTALERYGEACGLALERFTRQGLWLMELGLGDRLAGISSDRTLTPDRAIRRRSALQQLIDPAGMGNFGVLIQQKLAPK